MIGSKQVEIRQIECFPLRIPLRRSFVHKLAAHHESRPLIVRVVLSNGFIGYGEAQPRSYLSGETHASVAQALTVSLSNLVLRQQLATLEAAVELLTSDAAQSAREHAPAAFCGLELAILDAVGHSEGRSVVEILGPLRRTAIPYDGAVIGFLPPTALTLYLAQVRRQRKRLVKLKVGEPADVERLATVRRILGTELTLMVDANCAWSADEAIERIRSFDSFGLAAVEQPVAKQDLAGMARVQRELETPLMADESLCTLADARRLLELKACKMWNVRIGKCGGILGSIEVLKLAATHGIRCSLGVLVGETGILGAAGRLVAACHPELWQLEFDSSGAMEDGGLFDRWTPVMDNIAQLDPGLPGLGISLNSERLQQLADHSAGVA